MASLRILKFVGAYTVLGFVPLAVSFFLLPLYASYLPPAEYGLLTMANISQTFAMLFMTLGVDAALGRFFFDHLKDDVGRGRLLATGLGAIVLCCGVMALILAFAGEALFGLVWSELPFERYGWLILFGGLVQVVHSIVFTWHRNGENLRMAMAVSLVTTAASLAGSVIAIVFVRADALSALAGKTVGFALGAAPFVFLLLRSAHLALDLPLLRRLFDFGLPLTGYALVLYLLFNGDRMLLQRWFSLHDLGLYSLAVALISPIEIVLQAAQQAVQPVFYRKLEENEAGVAGKVGQFYVALVLFNVVALVAMVLFAKPVLLLFRGEKYADSSHFVAMLAYSQIFRMQYNAYSFSIFYSKRMRLMPAVAVVSVVGGAIVAWVASRYLGPLGVAVGVVGWKATQAIATRAAMKHIEELQVDVSGSLPWVFAAGAYVTLLYAVDAWQPDLKMMVAWVAGLTLCAGAGVTALRHARRLGLFPAAPTKSE